MLARLQMFWVAVRDSLWFMPGALTILGSALAFLTTSAERRGFLEDVLDRSWFFDMSAEGARGVLSAIAGGLITVTGVVFSVTIVALQLASSQFTPRLLRDFTADRGNQTVLGVFIGTFVYSVLILRVVQSAGEEGEGFVPRLGVTLAVVLTLVSIGFLIYFINHSARSIQVSTILDRVTSRTLRDVGRLFPEQIGRPDSDEAMTTRLPDAPAGVIRAAESGYLQAVDAGAVFRLGEKQDILVAMEPGIGEFVLAGQALARVWPASRADEEATKAIRAAFVLGTERTPEQDFEFGITEVSDIAVKALSPSVNDPTTAYQCIDRLAEILLALGSRNPPDAERTRDGTVHFVARHTTYERAVGLAFDQIRHYGASSPAIAKKLLATLTQLRELVPDWRRGPLDAQIEAVLGAARSELENPRERSAVERAATRLHA